MDRLRIKRTEQTTFGKRIHSKVGRQTILVDIKKIQQGEIEYFQ